MLLRFQGMSSFRAELRLNDSQSPLTESGDRRDAAPEGQWTLWAPIALVAIATLVYSGFSAALGPSGCFLLLAGLQSYFVVWCMIVGAVPVGFRWYHSDTDPYGFSIAAIAFLVLALILGFAAVATGPG